MNIFLLDHDPHISIQYHMDAHVRKMAIEYVQILCTVLREKFPDHHDIDTLYKSTHVNHPCVKWAMENWDHYEWLQWYARYIHTEYVYRFRKYHASRKILLKCEDIYLFYDKMVLHNPLEYPQCMPDQYKRDDPVDAYRAYYIGEKQHLAKWTNRPIPEWFEVNA